VNAVSLIHRPDKYTESKFIVSAYSTFEFEHFDILGQYFLSEVDTDPGSETINLDSVYLSG
jgi:hypothetical protein